MAEEVAVLEPPPAEGVEVAVLEPPPAAAELVHQPPAEAVEPDVRGARVAGDLGARRVGIPLEAGSARPGAARTGSRLAGSCWRSPLVLPVRRVRR
ncbi:MAG: hypothetical protein ACRDR6_02040 [Pseudonocardiaceae bacterium]